MKASSAFRSKMRREVGLPPISWQTTRVNLAEYSRIGFHAAEHSLKDIQQVCASSRLDI